jgi:O-Antigen ligase
MTPTTGAGLPSPAGWQQPGSRAHAPREDTTTTARIPWPLRLLFVGFVLYAALGKGFAYAGWPPFFVGELLLVALVVAALAGDLAIPRHAPALVTAGVVALAAVQLVFDALFGVTPLIETLRGLAPIYYASFGFVTYGLLRRYERRAGTNRVVDDVERAAARAAPWVMAAVLLLASFLIHQPGGIPAWPTSGVPILFTKSTDIAVTLALLLPIIGVGRWRGGSIRGQRILVVLWFATALLVVFRSRGALLALAIGLFVARPRPMRLVRGLVVAAAVLLVLYLSGVSLTIGDRELSARAAVEATMSLLGQPSDDQISGNYVATRDWRTTWWGDIWADVADERMALHGHGWGDNLAVRHGVVPRHQADDPRVLRLPHNAFFSLAGRGGVVVAAGFLLVPVLTLARSFRNSSWVEGSRAVEAARAGLAAATVVGLGDIFLESPQGGILFWCLIGFLWWSSGPHDPPMYRQASQGWAGEDREG